MKIDIIDEHSPLLPAIIELGDQNSSFLGFFAEKAFLRAASLENILAASDNNELLGYLLSYCAKSRAVIQHLCVAPDHRRKGVAKELVACLRQNTQHCRGMQLHCDRTFPAYHQWLKLGFVPIGEKRGRGKADTTLTRFWLDYGHPDLITAAIERSLESRLKVVLDVNVLYDLHNIGDIPNPESKGLEAPWIKDRIACLLTDEVFTEIDRLADQAERTRSKDIARGYPKVTASTDAVKKHEDILSPIFPGTKLSSDRRHLAIASAASVGYFITRDSELLNRADEVSTKCGTLPIDPTAFVIKFAEMERQFEYEPFRLSGSSIQLKRLGSGEVDKLDKKFLDNSSGEKKSELKSRLKLILARPDAFDAWIATRSGEAIAFFATSTTGQTLNVPFARLSNSDIAGVVARNILLLIIKTAVKSRMRLTSITDDHPSLSLIEAMHEAGFHRHGAIWVRPVLWGIESSTTLSNSIREVLSLFNDFTDPLTEVLHNLESGLEPNATGIQIARTERTIWPGKIANDQLPCFIVPIQAKWAMHLFDVDLANQDLFGALNLALDWEQVYYRSSRPGVLSAPARILWYVSDDQTFQGTQTIRATSNLSEVFVGPVKEVYKRFQRLGVFDWGDVKEIADKNPTGELMGFRFGMNEQFRAPISRDTLFEVLLRTMGSKPPLSTAVQIPFAAFSELYFLGTENAKKHA